MIEGLNIGKGEISPEEFYSLIKKRIERILIRTERLRSFYFNSQLLSLINLIFMVIMVNIILLQEGGSYQQRILTEYVRGIQSRAEEVVKALHGSQQ